TRGWAQRSLNEHAKLTQARADRPYQALYGVIQGAQYEDLRRKACQDLRAMSADFDGVQAGFDGYGLGGAFEKENLGTIVGWRTEEVPPDQPRQLLGSSGPADLSAAVEAGAGSFDAVSPPRVPRTGAFYTAYAPINLPRAQF